MDSTPSPKPTDPTSANPEPETLQPRVDAANPAAATPQPAQPPTGTTPRRRSYRPSHRATFIGLAVVVVILAINGAILEVVLKKQSKNDSLLNGQVTISSADLTRLGIDRNSIGESGVQLTVAPDSQFKGNLSVAGSTTLSGQVNLNGKLFGTDANLTQLQAGNTSLNQLSVNGNTTLSDLNLRKDLVVSGVTQLQGPVTLSQLLTVTNNINVVGNLAVGGILTVNNFSTQLLTVSGHLATSGSSPGVGPGGSALGSNGTISISGNDASGTIAINIGAGAVAGTLVNLAFHSQYASIPHVVITPVGVGADFYLTNLSAAGFSVAVTSGLPPGGYKIDYIVEQ